MKQWLRMSWLWWLWRRYGWMGMMGIIMPLISGIGIILLVTYLFRRNSSQVHSNGFHKQNSGFDILRKRYARGEIDSAEYLSRKRDRNQDHQRDYNLCVYAVIGAIIGAHLWQVFFYECGHYSLNPAEILMIWHAAWLFKGVMVWASCCIFSLILP